MRWSLPRARVRLEWRAGSTATPTSGKGEVELGEEAAAGVPRLLDHVVQLVELLRRCYGG